MNARRLRRLRADAQLLYRRDSLSPEQVVEHMLAVQSQDRRGGKLALRARSKAFDAAVVEHALCEDRSLVLTWLMRGTIHLVTPDDLPWLLALTAPGRATDSLRRLRQEGVSEPQVAKGVEVIDRVLREEGPLPRAEIRLRLKERSIPADGQALVHLIAASAYAGLSVVGPQQAGKPVHASAADWLGRDVAKEMAEVDRYVALSELVRRYLASRAPATVADISYWSGLPQRDVRIGLEGAAAHVVDCGGGLIDLKRRTTGDPGPVPARLLHTWDDYMLSWKDRSFMLPDEHRRSVIWGGGMFASTATVDGVVRGGWSAPASAQPFAVVVEPFEPLGKRAATELEREGSDLARFEGR